MVATHGLDLTDALCLMSLFVPFQEVRSVLNEVQGEIDAQQLLRQTMGDLPALSRQFMLSWSDKVLSS